MSTKALSGELNLGQSYDAAAAYNNPAPGRQYLRDISL